MPKTFCSGTYINLRDSSTVSCLWRIFNFQSFDGWKKVSSQKNRRCWDRLHKYSRRTRAHSRERRIKFSAKRQWRKRLRSKRKFSHLKDMSRYSLLPNFASSRAYIKTCVNTYRIIYIYIYIHIYLYLFSSSWYIFLGFGGRSFTWKVDRFTYMYT